LKTHQINSIIFDLGGVLIDWQPAYVFLKEFRGNKEKMDEFLSTVCAWEWNLNQDAGYPLEKATKERIALYPEYERLIKMYYGRWEEMLGLAHKDTLSVLDYLKNQKKYRLLALTNWSHETFPIAQKKFPWLEWFEGIVVSGEEKLRKPDPEIYQRLLHRYKVVPTQAVFIDDNIENVKAAESLGFYAIHFKSAEALVHELEHLEIKLPEKLVEKIKNPLMSLDL
jgi:2-haloacid dehalogenase